MEPRTMARVARALSDRRTWILPVHPPSPNGVRQMDDRWLSGDGRARRTARKPGERRSAEQAAADVLRYQFRIWKAAIASHRVDQLVTDPHVERAVDEGDELDARQPFAEFDEQGPGEPGRLVLITALRAVGDPDAGRGHAAAGDRSTIWRSALTTSRFAPATSPSRRRITSAVSAARTSSARESGGPPYGPNSG